MTGAPLPAPDARARGGLASVASAAARHPLWTLALLVALQTVPALGARDLWANDEVRHGDALRNLVEGGHALVLRMNGQAYPDKPPLWFLLVAALVPLFRDLRAAFFAASALSAFLFASATWLLARRVAGQDRDVSLAAALAALTVPIVSALAQTTRMDLLFSTAVVLSEAALYAAWTRPAERRWVPCGAALALVAAGIKGPLGIALPVATSLAFLAWTGRLRRLLSADVLAGTAVVVVGVGAYLAAVAWAEGPDYVGRLLGKEVWRRATAARENANPPWFYAAVLLPATLPWCATLPFLPWRRLRGAWRGARARRRGATDGATYLVSACVGGFLLLSLLSGKLVVYLAPLLPPAAVLLAGSLARLEAAPARRAWTAMAAAGLLVAAVLPFAGRLVPFDAEVRGLVPAAVAVAAGSVALVAARRRPVAEAALVAASGLVVTALVVALAVAPSLDPVLSPRVQALRLRDLADRGYAPIVFRTYGGTYAYHAGRPFPETGDPAVVERMLAQEARVVAAMPRKYLDRHRARWPALRVVSERWLLDGPQVIAVKDDGAEPADPR